MEVKCDFCGKICKKKPSEFRKHEKHYCTWECFVECLNNTPRKPKYIKKIRKIKYCLCCNKLIPEIAHFNNKYCNDECQYKYYFSIQENSDRRKLNSKMRHLRETKDRPINKCRYCQKEISANYLYSKHYCNEGCRYRYRMLKDPEGMRKKNRNWLENNRDKRKKYRKLNCHKEYERRKLRRTNDLNFAIQLRLRRLVFGCFEKYTKTGKVMSSKKYGIDYLAIIEHLKPFPKDISNYHIDHIIPLCSFNFINLDGSTNFEEIQKAFSPMNHQWLTAQENNNKRHFDGSMEIAIQKIRSYHANTNNI